MKKKTAGQKLPLNKLTIARLTATSENMVQGGLSLYCFYTRVCQASLKNPCITQTESPSCRCV